VFGSTKPRFEIQLYIKPNKKHGSMVVITFQNVFRLEMHRNKFLKNLFLISAHQNDVKI
jgi:hypothetical protein